MRRETCPCSALTALARRESFSASTVMQNVSPSFCGSTRPSPINCWKRDAQSIAQRAQVLFDQAAVESVVAGRHRRVRGKDRVLSHVAQRFVEAQLRRCPSSRE